MSNVSLMDQVKEIIEKNGKSKEQLIRIALEVQSISGTNSVPEEALAYIANELDMPLSKAYETISFYAMFNTTPKGKYLVEVCKSAPCHVSKADKSITALVEKVLGIKVGETTADNLFTVEYTSCFGACDVAPAVKIGEEVYGFLDEKKFTDVINSLKGVK